MFIASTSPILWEIEEYEYVAYLNIRPYAWPIKTIHILALWLKFKPLFPSIQYTISIGYQLSSQPIARLVNLYATHYTYPFKDAIFLDLLLISLHEFGNHFVINYRNMLIYIDCVEQWVVYFVS